MIRGVIASGAVFELDGNSIGIKRSLSQQDLRYYALYWDKVVIPTSALIHVPIPEEDVLLATGVVERPRLHVASFSGSGNAMAKEAMRSQMEIAKDILLKDRQNDWVLHQFGDELLVPDGLATERTLLRFDLANTLPVPPGATPIEEILDFKHRRADDLEALHRSIELAYQEALREPDQSLGAKAAIRDLQQAVEGLTRVSNERWTTSTSYSHTIELNVDGGKLVQGVTAGAVLDFFSGGVTMGGGAAMGALASMFSFKANRTKTFTPAADRLKLAYLSKAKDEQIL